MKSLDVAIAGAGIAGLTLAIALEHFGHRVQLYEKRSHFGCEGAGILLAANALSVLEPFGVIDKLRAVGRRIDALNIRDARGKLIRRVDALDTIALHRDDLHKILREEVKSPISMECDSLPNARFDLRVGADGFYSRVRDEMAVHTKITDSHQVCWRGVVEYKRDNSDEYWIKERRVGIIPISDCHIYIYLVLSGKEALGVGERWDSLDKLCDFFGGLPIEVLEILRLLDIEQLRCDAMKQIEVSPWSVENTVLVGDAAHAMTPNLGQGACQAIEDAVVLAEVLTVESSLEEAFALYGKLRQRRVEWIQRESWRMGMMAHMRSEVGCWLRNTAMRHMPSFIERRMMERLMTVPR